MRFIGNAPVDGEVRAIASGALATGDTVIVNSDGTVSVVAGSDASAGTPVVFNAAVSVMSPSSSVFDSSSNKIVVAYADYGNSQYGTAVVGTISGTSISFGSPAVFESAAIGGTAVTLDSANNKIVIAYRDEANSNRGTAVVGTVSGTSISFGTPVVFETGAIERENGITFHSGRNKVVVA